jgi:hypothetical protein
MRAQVDCGSAPAQQKKAEGRGGESQEARRAYECTNHAAGRGRSGSSRGAVGKMAEVTVVAMAVTVVTVVAVVTMVLAATVVVWRRETMAATVAGVNHRDADGEDERVRRGEMAQWCRRVVCTRDVPHS